MASEARPGRRVRVLATTLALAACSHDPRQFALRAPVLRDQDLDLVHIDCDDAKPGELCAPELYESSFSWDAVDNTVTRPVSKFFQVDSYGEAENVNAFDEVPDSSCSRIASARVP